MTFDDIIGQSEAKARLLTELEQNKVAHALMLCGQEGCGALPLAIAYAQMLLKGNVMAEKLQHPDLHFAFPIFNKKKSCCCEDFIDEWRELCLSQPYFGMEEWMAACGAENQQLIIYERESDEIFKTLSLKSSQGGYKVLVMWLPEKMHESCANKLLKLLEEPPAQTVFLLVSEQPEKVLLTIRSRCQMINCSRLQSADIETALVEKYKILPAEAKRISRSCSGSMVAALRTITDNSDSKIFFDMFVQLMRLAYVRNVKEMKLWSEKLAKFGRERQKAFLLYSQRMIRENFIYNFHRQDELNYMNEDEAGFAVRFAPFINENNVIGIMDELSLAQRDIAQNTNPNMVFFDFALKMIVLIKNR
ncbi:MAG: DNA polymerase III subunit delta [Bacteroidaceae bacterium]|jgi:DNA polymerase-3 subunit delta'|nr:DNA polymerase III subunit delta [Bacteroidaceae bacterium]